MPLVDIMKRQFGQEQAEGFNNVVKTSLDELLNKITDAKDSTDNAVLSLQQGQVPGISTDIGNAPDMNGNDVDGGEFKASKPAHNNRDDGFNATMPASGPEDEPLGRAKKPVPEPVQENKARGMTRRHVASRGR